MQKLNKRMLFMLQAKLKVHNSKWTASFSLDTIGSNGVVICHDKERQRKYQVFHKIVTPYTSLVPLYLGWVEGVGWGGVGRKRIQLVVCVWGWGEARRCGRGEGWG